MVVMRRIDLTPAPGTTGTGSMDVTAAVEFDLVSANQYDGDERRVLESVRIPPSWHITVRPESPEGIDLEFRPREKSDSAERGSMADKRLHAKP